MAKALGLLDIDNLFVNLTQVTLDRGANQRGIAFAGGSTGLNSCQGAKWQSMTLRELSDVDLAEMGLDFSGIHERHCITIVARQMTFWLCREFKQSSCALMCHVAH